MSSKIKDKICSSSAQDSFHNTGVKFVNC